MFSFYDTFLCPLLLYLRHCCLLNSYVFTLKPTNSFMACPPNSSCINPINFIFFPFANRLSNSKFEMSNLVSTSSAVSINIFCFYMNNETVCLHITKFYIFIIFWPYIIISCLNNLYYKIII